MMAMVLSLKNAFQPLLFAGVDGWSGDSMNPTLKERYYTNVHKMSFDRWMKAANVEHATRVSEDPTLNRKSLMFHMYLWWAINLLLYEKNWNLERFKFEKNEIWRKIQIWRIQFFNWKKSKKIQKKIIQRLKKWIQKNWLYFKNEFNYYFILFSELVLSKIMIRNDM